MNREQRLAALKAAVLEALHHAHQLLHIDGIDEESGEPSLAATVEEYIDSAACELGISEEADEVMNRDDERN